jgi:hypothetical protein
MATRTPHSASLRFIRREGNTTATMQSFSRLRPTLTLEQLRLIGTAINGIRPNTQPVREGQFTIMDELSV